MSTNYVDISGSWSCPARAGKILKITQTGAAGRCVLASESWTFEVKERVATISNGITGVVSQDGKVIIWSNGYTYTRASPAKVTYGGAKVTVKSWKGDYLHRPDSAKGVTTWGTGVGNEWTLEQLDSGTITLKSWKGDYLHRPDSANDVTTWGTGIGNEWTIEIIERTQKLINVKSITRADDVPHLWGAVDTAGIAGVPIAFLELTWVDQGWGNRKGHIHGRKDGGAWVGISTDAAEHELTRESFEIPAALLGGKIELGYSVGSGGEHKLFITDAEVEIKSSA